jgi:ABC-type sugar transport system ATPase subunit
MNVTTIYVTHDQTEAMTMGNRIAVMRKGVLQQLGRPRSSMTALRIYSSRRSSVHPR